MSLLKTCCNCYKKKKLQSFYKHKATKSGVGGMCISCLKIYYIQNRKHLIVYKKQHYKANKQQWIERDLLKKYNITFQQFEQMKTYQDNRCAICGQIFASRQDTHVDHNHTNGHLRGLLCRKCNLGIGYLCDSETILNQALNYIKKWRPNESAED